MASSAAAITSFQYGRRLSHLVTQILLALRRAKSVSVLQRHLLEDPMKRVDAAPILAHLTDLVSQRLTHASALAKSAVACSEQANADATFAIAMDIEEPLYEASTLLRAVILLKRLAADS